MARETDLFGRPKPWWLQTKKRAPEIVKPISGGMLLFRILWSCVPDFALAITFYITWVDPYRFGERTVHHLVFVMLVEFLVVHATGFLGAISARDLGRWERVGMFTALSLLYLLFAASFAAMYQGIWPVIAMTYLIASKLPNIFFRPTSDDAMMGVMANWAAMVCLYLGAIFASFAYDVPPLGITPEVIAAQHFDVGGEWPEKPYLVMASGVIYFTGLGFLSILTELIMFAGVRRRWAAADKA